MTNKLTPSLIAVGALLLGFNHNASAHTMLGLLGNTANATDYYQVNCATTSGNPTHHLYFTLKDNVADSTLVGMTVFSPNATGNTKAYTIIDPTGGDSYADAKTIVGGEGVYSIAVFKTAAAAQNYGLLVHCEDVNGTETNATGLAVSSRVNDQ